MVLVMRYVTAIRSVVVVDFVVGAVDADEDVPVLLGSPQLTQGEVAVAARFRPRPQVPQFLLAFAQH